MEIQIISLTGLTFKLQVTPRDSVRRVKELIQAAQNYSPDECQLLYQRKELKDTQSLQELEIPNNAKVYLILKLSSGFDIFVKSLTGKTIVINAVKSVRIHDLKTRIQDKEGIPPDQQLLTFEGAGLTDENRTIESYGIYAESVLDLFLKLHNAYYLRIQTAPTAVFQLEIESSHTLRQLKEAIQLKAQIAESNQRLFVSGKELIGDTNTLTNFNLQGFSTVQVLNKLANRLIVTVTTASQLTFYVQVQRSQTVLDVKTELRDVYTLPLNHQRLSINGVTLNEDCSISTYQNKNRCLLSLEKITTLNIRDPSGQMLLLEVDLFQTVSLIKAKVLALTKQPLRPEDLQLTYKGTKLLEDLTLEWYKIPEEETIVLTSCYCDLTFELLSGRRFWISIPNLDLPLSALKQRIEAVQGLLATEQSLYFNSSELSDLHILQVSSSSVGLKHPPIKVYQSSDELVVTRSAGAELKIPYLFDFPVSQLREKVSTQLKLPTNDVFLTLDGRELNDPKECLRDLSAASKIQVSVSWKVLVRDLTGKVLTIRIRDSDSIPRIKEKVGTLGNVPIKDVRLLYKKGELETGVIATLRGFGPNSVLHLQAAFQVVP